MKRISVLAVVIGLAALGARAQTNVTTTGGTPGNLAKFTGSSAIGNSVVAENNGNIGIGLSNPNAKLEVLDFRNLDANGVGPNAILGSANCTLNNFCSAVRGDAHGGFNIGVVGVNYVLDGQSGGGGVTGLTFGTTGFHYGVFGNAQGTTGNGIGVLGTTFSPDGVGVSGLAHAGHGVGVNGNGDGDGSEGVQGVTASQAGFAVGTRGTASGSTGNGVGIFGEAFSPDGQAALFVNRSGGDILHGRISGGQDNVFRVDGAGRVFANGGFRPFGADFAESLAVKGRSEQYSPGDVLVIDPSGLRRITESQTPYSTLVAGIYSTQPGVVASQHRVDEALPNNEVPLAVVGVVPCKVTAENGPIAAGDLLVTSSTPGHAMKGTDRSKLVGAVVAKALEPLKEGAGVIQVLVTLQ
jgi:hypothetical protein